MPAAHRAARSQKAAEDGRRRTRRYAAGKPQRCDGGGAIVRGGVAIVKEPRVGSHIATLRACPSDLREADRSRRARGLVIEASRSSPFIAEKTRQTGVLTRAHASRAPGRTVRRQCESDKALSQMAFLNADEPIVGRGFFPLDFASCEWKTAPAHERSLRENCTTSNGHRAAKPCLWSLPSAPSASARPFRRAFMRATFRAERPRS